MFPIKSLVLLSLIFFSMHSIDAFFITAKLEKLVALSSLHNCKMLAFGIESLDPELDAYMQFCPASLLRFATKESNSKISSLVRQLCFDDQKIDQHREFCNNFVDLKLQMLQANICQNPTIDTQVISAGFYDECDFETEKIGNILIEYCKLEDRRAHLIDTKLQTVEIQKATENQESTDGEEKKIELSTAKSEQTQVQFDSKVETPDPQKPIKSMERKCEVLRKKIEL